MSSSVIDYLLEPVSSDEPCGPCIEYDGRFQSLVAASAGRDEQQLGSNIIPASDPDWHFLVKESSALLNESRDIRLLCIWILGSLRTRGLPGFAEGIAVIARLLVNHWKYLHPVIESDGDWYMRANAVSGLADPDSILRALRDSSVGSLVGIPVTVRDVCNLCDSQQDDGSPFSSFEQLFAAVHENISDCAERLSANLQVLEDINSIKTAFLSNLGTEAVPSLDAVEHVFRSLVRLYQPSPSESTGPEVGNAVTAEITSSAIAANATLAAVKSRSDALKALALAREYFERYEPSNPAAILIQRVERLASASFLDIIEEMAPSSMDHIKMQAGLNR